MGHDGSGEIEYGGSRLYATQLPKNRTSGVGGSVVVSASLGVFVVLGWYKRLWWTLACTFQKESEGKMVD
jgi:hypothetical protein